MFQARWRWNLNRSLMVLRFRNGKRNPPPIQRMESDDLLAAVFPQAAACQDNAIGPIEIPDHLLVRQTIDDTLHEALDIDGLRSLLERIEARRGRGSTAARPPSRRSSPTRSSPPGPYAFLDDEEFQNRRTNAVRLRRGLNVDLASIGALDPDAIEQVHAEIAPDARHRRTICTTCCPRWSLSPARQEWRPPVDRAAGAGAGRRRSDRDGRELWCTTECRREAGLALDGDDAAAARVVRGHLELSGITTVEALAGGHAAAPGPGGRRPRRAAARGVRPPGPLQPPAPSGPSGWPAASWPACTATPGGPGGSRSSPRRRRTSCGSCCAGSTWRPAPSLPATPAWPTVIEQLQGFEAAAVAWEPELLARRLHHYSPGLAGPASATTARWPGCGWPRARATTPTARAAAPSKATPIAVVFRSDLDWLLEAARAGAPAGEPTVGATAEIIEVLRASGALRSPPTWPRPPAACPTTSSGACGRA